MHCSGLAFKKLLDQRLPESFLSSVVFTLQSAREDGNFVTSESRSVSLQPLIGEAANPAANGGPPKAAWIRPSRPPPAPPTATDLEGAAVSAFPYVTSPQTCIFGMLVSNIMKALHSLSFSRVPPG